MKARTSIVAAALLGLVVAACSGAAAQTVKAPTTGAPTAAVVAPAAATASAATPPASAYPATNASAAGTHDPAAHAAPAAASQVAVSTVAPTPAAPAATPAATPTAKPVVTLAPTPQPQSGPVAVTLTDIAIKLDRSSATAGSVTFAVKNVGTVIHQLVVLKTDVAQNLLPADPSKPGMVTEPGLVSQTQIINPGGTASLTLTLGAGNYVLMCNQPAHYLIGMHVGFTIN